MSAGQKLKYLIFSILPLVLLLAVLETGLRCYDHFRLGGYRCRIERLVELEAAGPYYGSGNMSNELGFSGRGKFDPKKKRNEYRILVLGGSGAAGSSDCNWPDIMAGELNKKGTGRHVRVINGGIGGHTSSGEKKFMTRWVQLRPDLVIIYDGWNDMYFSHYLPEEYAEQFEISNTYYYPTFGERAEDFLARHSTLFRKAKMLAEGFKTALKREGPCDKTGGKKDEALGKVIPLALNPVKKEEGTEYTPGKPFKMNLDWRQGSKVKTIDPDGPVRDDMSGIYRTNLDEMARLAARNGAKVILVQQPDLLYHSMKYPELFDGEEDELVSVIGHEGLRRDWMNTVAVLYPRGYDAMREVAEQNDNVLGVHRIDGIFDGYPEKLSFWLTDSCHQTPKGREVIGKHMADLVYGKVFADR